MTLLSEIYDVTLKRGNRGAAKGGFVRPTIGEHFMTHKDYFEVIGFRDIPELGKNIGDFYEGGYLAGVIDSTQTAGSSGKRYALIVAPKAEGQTNIGWGYNGSTGATSRWDGVQNTINLLSYSSSHAPQFCNNLTINGYSDWYMPAIDELELLYRNFKPTTQINASPSFSFYGETLTGGNGYNPNSDPLGNVYTIDDPLQVELPIFRGGGAESLTGTLWSSTDALQYRAWVQVFTHINGDWAGSRSRLIKTNNYTVRAVRRLTL
jgi:hypothetical protein